MAAEAMQAERTAHEQRRDQLHGMEENDDKFEELLRDENRWKEKYRRRTKTLLASVREPENKAEYLETLELRHEDLVQASEFLQETYVELIALGTTLQKNVRDIAKSKQDKATDFDHHTK